MQTLLIKFYLFDFYFGLFFHSGRPDPDNDGPGPPVLTAVQRNLPFDVAEVLPLVGTAQAPPVLLVPPGLGIADLAGFIALARLRGEALTYGHSGLAWVDPC